MTFLNFTFQDPSPLINYAGQWVEGTTNDSFAGRYSQGSFTVTSVAGTTATLTFAGTSITIFGGKRPNHGNYSAVLDDGPEFVGDGNADNVFQFPLWNAQNLSNSQHTVVLTNVPTGQGPFLDVDFISIGRELGPPGYNGPISNVTLDDESPFVVYNGSWTPSFSSSAFNLSLHGTTEQGSTVSVFFQGSSIELYGSYLGAPFQVNLDNQLPRELAGPDVPLDLQQDHPQTLLFLADGLEENKTHAVTLTNSASSSGRPLFFDFAVVRSSQKFFNENTPSPNPDFTVPTTAAASSAVRQKSSTGAIVGGVIGGVAGVIILAFIGFILFRRSKYYHQSSKRSAEDGNMNEVSSSDLVPQFRASTLTPYVLPNIPSAPSSSSHTKGSISSIPVSSRQDSSSISLPASSTAYAPPSSQRLSEISSSLTETVSTHHQLPIIIEGSSYVLQEQDAGRLVQTRLPPMYNDHWQGTAPT
ncbi:hypothetical protein Clacol_000084 [Clathrus columnatus]|uniref:Uncharacterized protein n=1 Tax=Clathrus columnatus TaxID=1419009 RepID=A0AAV4ZWA5_9AGAM|nr:hypothetical protein Clacol_000084 [Clathrus columnatus]